MILTMFTGLNGLNVNNNNIYIWLSFILSAIATCVSMIRTVFKFQKRSSLHNTAKGQFSDLYKDLYNKLIVGFNSKNEIEEVLRLYNEKVKFINSYAPPYSRCI